MNQEIKSKLNLLIKEYETISKINSELKKEQIDNLSIKIGKRQEEIIEEEKDFGKVMLVMALLDDYINDISINMAQNKAYRVTCSLLIKHDFDAFDKFKGL
jgi:hypothetical protein